MAFLRSEFENAPKQLLWENDLDSMMFNNLKDLHFFFFFFFFFKFTLFTANLLLKIPLLIFFHFQLLNYLWPKLAIDGDGNGRRRLRGWRFGVVSERWRSASPSRCGRFFAAATARTAGDRSPTLGLQRIATFLDLVRLRLVASRTALRRGAVRMRGHRRWSRQREKSVRDGCSEAISNKFTRLRKTFDTFEMRIFVLLLVLVQHEIQAKEFILPPSNHETEPNAPLPEFARKGTSIRLHFARYSSRNKIVSENKRLVPTGSNPLHNK
ncbi:clavata3-like [Striga asiatica]|uniref:Clavata3-like n=1 Tax=Striga asiatica TaxID=4170 RepID=A0A5A7R7D0_STRAF|nr:clavata3-like [Striga asiatica]